MAQNTIEQGVALAAGIVGILLGCLGLINSVCGFIWVGYGGGGGHGLWSGFGVSKNAVYSSLNHLTSLFSMYQSIIYEQRKKFTRFMNKETGLYSLPLESR